MPSTFTNSQKSAVPTAYYAVFGIVEPLITFVGLLEGIFYPGKVLSRHGTWPNGLTEAPAVRAIVCQMVITHAIIGWVNASVLRAIRKLPSPALQEMIARSLLIPLAIGDILRQLGMFYGMGGIRREAEGWPQALWLNVIVGIALFIPRVCWLLGIGRYVATRDSKLVGGD